MITELSVNDPHQETGSFFYSRLRFRNNVVKMWYLSSYDESDCLNRYVRPATSGTQPNGKPESTLRSVGLPRMGREHVDETMKTRANINDIDFDLVGRAGALKNPAALVCRTEAGQSDEYRSKEI